MKHGSKLFLTLLFTLLGVFTVDSISAQQAVRAKATAVSSAKKPLDAKALELNSRAARTLKRWIEAKHVELLDTGHFVPMKNPGNTSQTSGNLPGGQPTSYASGTNCAKIECPDVFDDSVTCWECH